MKVAFIGAFETEKGCPHWDGIHQACEVLGLNYYLGDIRSNRNEVIKHLKLYKPDVIIHCLLDCLDNSIIDECKEMCSVNALYYVDALKIGCADKLHSVVDIGFFGNTEFVNKFNKQGLKSYFIQQAYQMHDVPRVNDSEYHKVVFIGSARYPRRMFLIDNLSKYYKVDIIGKQGWSGRAEIYKRMPEIYRTSDYCLSTSLFKDISCYSSNRLYCILGCRGFAVVERFKDCEKLFKNHKHLTYFDTPEEYRDIIEYYDKHPKAKEKVAIEGYRLVTERHTYIHRVRDMLIYIRQHFTFQPVEVVVEQIEEAMTTREEEPDVEIPEPLPVQIPKPQEIDIDKPKEIVKEKEVVKKIVKPKPILIRLNNEENVYVVNGEYKELISSREIFEKAGYDFKDVVSLDSVKFSQYKFKNQVLVQKDPKIH